MQMTRSKMKCYFTTNLMAVMVVVCFLSVGSMAMADVYRDSAHGSASTGVKREGTTYPQGDCTHCHDTFDASICQNPLMLFAADNPTSQTENFCFQCHSGKGTYCYHEGDTGSCTATWRPTINMTASYNVYAWWVDGPNRATNAPYTIYYADIETHDDCSPIVIVSETVRVNQQVNGGQWNLLGTYPFADGTSGRVVLSDDANGYVIADAIKWEFDGWTPPPPEDPCYSSTGDPPSFDFVVDNLTAEFVCDWTCVNHSGAHPGGGDSVQAGGIVNNEYGATFGGGAPKFDSVYDAFNPLGTWASSHDLAEVQSYAMGRSWGTWMTGDTNACLVCHDQHLSQKNFPVLASVNGGVKTAVRRGNDVNTRPGDLWGDHSGIVGRPETMADLMLEWGMIYQAPYYGGTGDPVTGPFEPAGDSTADGSNLPNFFGACAETCHSEAIDPVDGPIAVDWTTSMHGGGTANNSPGDWGWLKPPYDEAFRGSYVLSCTDCHETHGSTNATLLRTTVNGVSGLTTGDKGCNYPDGGYWYYFCSACHDIDYRFETGEGHMAVWPEARCGDNVGCHLFKTMGYDQCPGGDHSRSF